MDTQTFVNINKSYFISCSTIALKGALVGYFPFIAIPPWSYVYDKIAGFLINKLADGLEMTSFFIYIDIRTDLQGKVYFKAKMAGLEAEKTGDQIKIKEAEIEIIKAFRNFVKFNN